MVFEDPSDKDEGGAGDFFCSDSLTDIGQCSADDFFIWPGRPIDNDNGTVFAVMRR